MVPLFRDQPLEKRRQRLYGDVVIADSRASLTFVIAAGAIAVSLIVWASLATYHRAERVAGVLVTNAPTVKVYPLRPGVVEQLFVREGQEVRKGQRLAYIGLDLTNAERRGAGRDTIDALTRQRDLVAVSIASAQQQHDQDRKRLGELIATNARERASVSRQLTIQREIAQVAQATYHRIEPLVQEGFVSQLDLQRRKQEALVARQQLEHLEQSNAQLEATGIQLRGQLNGLRPAIASRISELEGQKRSIQQQLAQASVGVGYLITAVADGRVVNLQSGAGRTVDARRPLLTILPQRVQLQADLFAPSRAAGFLARGQEVRIMYDAFPYQKFGAFRGRILQVAAAPLVPGEVEVPLELEEAVYRVRVELDDQQIEAFGMRHRLQPGLRLQANVLLERRTFLDWVLAPINGVRNRT